MRWKVLILTVLCFSFVLHIKAQTPCKDSFPPSLFLNYSFEDYGACNPAWSGEGGLIDGNSSAVNISVPYWHATDINQSPRYYNYACRVPGYSLFDESYLNSNTGYPGIPNPLPDGKGLVSIEQYNHYIIGENIPESKTKKIYVTSCLLSKLKAGITYYFDFKIGFSLFNPNFNHVTGYWSSPSPINVGIFGRADCPDFPVSNSPDSSLGCLADRPGWINLGQVRLHGHRKWVEGFIEFTPSQDISAVAVGPSCDYNENIADTFALYYMDDFILATQHDFAYKNITVLSGDPCNGNFVLEASQYNNASYQWYKDDELIEGATSQTYAVPDNAEGYYHANISVGNICFNSLPYPVYFSSLKNFKIAGDTMTCLPNSVKLDATWTDVQKYLWQDGNTNTVYNATVSGNYSVQVTDINGCTKKQSIHVDIQDCSGCKVFLPNAFTPNNDGLNDVFMPLLPDCHGLGFEHYHMKIYNRFGQLIFQSNNPSVGWNGIFNNKTALQGVYVYVVQYNFFQSKRVQMKGTVFLMR